METLNTNRLILRPWTMDDVEACYLYASSPDVGPNAGWKPHESLEESRELLEQWTAEDYPDIIFAMEEKGTGSIVGSIGLHTDTHRAPSAECRMLGYCIAKEHWGKGFATEAAQAVIDYAFQRLRVKLLTVDHYVDNKGSRRVIEKCHFRYEGTLRRALQIYDGSYRDTCFYSMSAAEYRLNRAKEAGLSLVLPENVSKEASLAYHNEWDTEVSPGAMRLHGRSYEKWLDDTQARRTHASEERVQETAYYFVDRAGRILGAIGLRHKLNDYLLHYAGHIGYGIRPTCRGKGLAPYMLALCLEKARERGLTRVLVTCDDENLPSAGTIEACGGELENKVEEDGRLTRRYWIQI